MAWRTVMIQNPARLSLHNRQLKLLNDEGEFSLPLEDITALVLESPQISLTSALLAYCMEQGVAVVTCDNQHLPNGMLHPFHPHSRQSRVAQLQARMTEPLRKRLWQKIIQQKIGNQARCLEMAAGQEVAKRLHALIKRVQSGDSDNIEAQAARYYWPLLFDASFRRQDEAQTVNAALNYGYAVVRAFVARSQVAYGLQPCYGLHHANELNAFNLTDDVMEVLRPWVDWQVWQMRSQGLLTGKSLTLAERQQLAGIGQQHCQWEKEIHTLAYSCELLASGLVQAMEQKKTAALLMPLLPQKPQLLQEHPQ